VERSPRPRVALAAVVIVEFPFANRTLGEHNERKVPPAGTHSACSRDTSFLRLRSPAQNKRHRVAKWTSLRHAVALRRFGLTLLGDPPESGGFCSKNPASLADRDDGRDLGHLAAPIEVVEGRSVGHQHSGSHGVGRRHPGRGRAGPRRPGTHSRLRRSRTRRRSRLAAPRRGQGRPRRAYRRRSQGRLKRAARARPDGYRRDPRTRRRLADRAWHHCLRRHPAGAAAGQTRRAHPRDRSCPGPPRQRAQRATDGSGSGVWRRGNGGGERKCQRECYRERCAVRSDATGYKLCDSDEAHGYRRRGEGPIRLGVNLSSDGSTALVRASGQNSGHGAAYVFTRSGSVWTQQAELIVSGMTGSLAAGDAALSSDGSTALLSDGQSAAYVFTRSGPEWIDTTPTGAVARWPR
jgi:hypothetical protein